MTAGTKRTSATPLRPSWPVVAAMVAVALGFVTFLYRFNQLGGTLGGFENDHFVQLSTARQIVGGDMPFRDYNEIGAPLTSFASAVGQMVGGHALLPDAILTMGAIALSTAVICWLAARASGSVAIAIVLTLIAIALAPRPYAYPKVLLYSFGIFTAWRYLDRPSTVRLALFGSVIGLGFLFRHDHGAYLGTFGLVLLLMHEGMTPAFIRRAAILTAVAAAWALPYLALMQVNGGVVEYFRRAMVYASRDAERTSFKAPTFTLGSGEPLVRIAPEPPPVPVEIKVRWAPDVAPATRQDLETRYQLVKAEPREGRTWAYELADPSNRNVAAIVRDPKVEDTDGIDRSRLAIADDESRSDRLGQFLARVRLAPELTNASNAVAWLYYLGMCVAPLAAVALIARRGRESAQAERVYLLPVVVLGAILSVTLMSRGATAIRLPDVSAPMAVLAGWLIALAMASARRGWKEGTSRVRLQGLAVAAATVALVVVTGGAAVVLGDVPDRVDTADLDGGLRVALQRTSHVAAALSSSPPLSEFPDLDHPGSLRVAEYLGACTASEDRVFVFGNYPEVYFFSGRRFGGSHVWLVPGFYTSHRDQQTIIDRLTRWRVPIVVTEPAAEYDNAYRKYFPEVTAFLDRQYRDAGTVLFGGLSLRVFVHASLPTVGSYRTTAGAQLPCFGTGHVLQARTQ